MNIFREIGKLFRRDTKRARKALIRGFKPWLEALEDRITPSEITWRGHQNTNRSDNWSVQANWVGGDFPEAGDTVYIPNGTNCVVDQPETVAGVNVGRAGQFGNASLRVSANLTVNGAVAVFSAPAGGWSQLLIESRATLSARGAITVNGRRDDTRIVVDGTLATTQTITVSGTASMELRSRANVRATTVTIQQSATLFVATINNQANLTGNLVNEGLVDMTRLT